MKKLLICSEYCFKYLEQFKEQNLVIDSFLWVQIPLKQLTPLPFSAIISRYKRRQNQGFLRAIICSNIFSYPLDTPKFKQSIFRSLKEKLVMYQFNVEGDMGRHHLSISGASSECGISTSTINRTAGKTFPPKRRLSEGRVGFWVFQIVEWLQGKRGGWQ